MKIIINNIEFGYDTGCRLLKLKHEDCPMKELEDIWEDIIPMTFKEIATELRNTEQRRVAMGCLGLERLVKEVKPKLLDKKTLKKQTTWVNEKGELKTKKFNDTYELYEVKGEVWGENAESRWSRTPQSVHYVKCKDTSTDREYFIWVDAQDVYRTNDDREQRWYSSSEDYGKMINAIQAIAWTIQTNISKDMIEEIVRQGDCVMIKKRPGAFSGDVRHLTEKEYRELLVLES